MLDFQLDLRHTFHCNRHGLFYSLALLEAHTPVLSTCPACVQEQQATLRESLPVTARECRCCAPHDE